MPKINNYWKAPVKKRHNKTYKGKLTKKRKEIRDNRILAFMAIWFISIAINAVADTSNDYTIPNFVDTKVEAQLEDRHESVAVINPVAVSLPVMVNVEPTKEDVKKEIIKQSRDFGLNENKMLALAFCESGYNYKAKNPKSTARGVYQYLIGTWEETESAKNGIERNDYKANIREAMLDISNGESWRWVDCWKKI